MGRTPVGSAGGRAIERLKAAARTGVAVAPFLIVAFYGMLLSAPSTRNRARWMMAENHHVELLTFASLFLAMILAARLAWKARRTTLVAVFWALFSAGLLFAAMEEVAWGQTFFGFETPQVLQGLNRQNELTLHNLPGLHNRTEFFRIAFGLGGIFGVWLYSRNRLRQIAPPPVLLSWFVLIAVLAGLDLLNDFYRIHKRFDKNIHELSEVVEMMVGFSALLFVWLKKDGGQT